jgi:hypothetical protein
MLSPSSCCTNGCTTAAKTEQADPVAMLATALLGLTPADRARLAALLVGRQPGQAEKAEGHPD